MTWLTCSYLTCKSHVSWHVSQKCRTRHIQASGKRSKRPTTTWMCLLLVAVTMTAHCKQVLIGRRVWRLWSQRWVFREFCFQVTKQNSWIRHQHLSEEEPVSERSCDAIRTEVVTTTIKNNLAKELTPKYHRTVNSGAPSAREMAATARIVLTNMKMGRS